MNDCSWNCLSGQIAGEYPLEFLSYLQAQLHAGKSAVFLTRSPRNAALLYLLLPLAACDSSLHPFAECSHESLFVLVLVDLHHS